MKTSLLLPALITVTAFSAAALPPKVEGERKL